MNKIRIIGLVLITIGIGVIFAPYNDLTGFLSGCFIGGGTVMLITGKIGRNKSN
ncbi:hypothetical protein LZF95_09460 [Algoriphagus sp. AGSA1]|uniref:hypothetical protein n=1 Tax=Algoriphagus sp. AGSA1 TaxID=2907213 RepID=UPI001F1F2302|nr:hypothetical protein [Algoriphagus sp. AGSA1]MCE7054898.1 hypothetical protein [Algoriphagus sp. AGSA1]